MLRRIMTFTLFACLALPAHGRAEMTGSGAGSRGVHAGLLLGVGGMDARDYDAWGNVGLSLGVYPRTNVRVDGILSAGGVAFEPASVLGTAIEDQGADLYGLDLTVRYYLPARGGERRIFPLAGVGAAGMYWHYAALATVAEAGEPRTYRFDGIYRFSVYAGAGATLFRRPWLDVDLTLARGVWMYGSRTGNGVENDMFRTTGFTRVTLEAGRRFR